ncbi:RNA-directed DNA polymerase from mobile element jockey [Varanus komodoensis]|nr:RNA-directed DNA polymerase from mobile element jockey [Varanus komodoensis]
MNPEGSELLPLPALTSKPGQPHESGVYLKFGVPQGSVLGPVLFNIFINDLYEEVQGKVIRFADDTKLGGIANILEDRMKIQGDLDNPEHWAESNRMRFDRDKRQVLHLGKRNQMH